MSRKVTIVIIIIILLAAAMGGMYYYHYIYKDPNAMNARELQETNVAYDSILSAINADTAEYQYTVLINPVAGGGNKGLSNANLHESDVALAIAKYVKELNTDTTLRIVLTRETDTNPTFEQRSGLVGMVNPDVIINIQLDSSDDSQVMGTKVYYCDGYYDYKLTNAELANALEMSIVSRCENMALGVAPAEGERFEFIYGRETAVSAVSVGYVTNTTEASACLSDAYRQNVARGILDAIALVRGKNE